MGEAIINNKDKVKINDLIFRELIKRGYSLEGNTRVWDIADSKLWYLTPEQSKAYLDLEENNEYKKDTGQNQAQNLVAENIDEILDKIGGDAFNIVDLGCGDGKKATEFVKKLKEKNPELKLRYCPIDISGYMVKRAIETFSSLIKDEIVEFKYNISDFENLENITPLLRNDGFEKNIILLLGNTLGNFEVNSLLYEIRTSMKTDDVFLVDTAIDDDKQEERTKSYNENERAKEWLTYVPLQLGLDKEDIELGFRFRNSRIEAYCTILNDKSVKFQDKSIDFKKGDQIVIVVAYKHKEEDLKTYLNMYFDDVSVKISEDNSKALVFCKK